MTIAQLRDVKKPQTRLTGLLVAAALTACQTVPSNPQNSAPDGTVSFKRMQASKRVNVVLNGRLKVPSSLNVAAGVTLISNNSGGLVSNNVGSMRSALAFGIRQVGAGSLSLVAVQGARLVLVDAADKRLPVADEIKTDDTGAFRFTGVPAGYSYVVRAEVPTSDNKVAVFRALVKVTELGAIVDIDPASTMVTTSIVAELPRGDLGEFSPEKFKAARETVAGKLSSVNLPDFTDVDAVQANIKDLSSQVVELRELLSEMQAELREVKRSLDNLRDRTPPIALAPSPLVSPTLAPAPKPVSTPTSTPLGTSSGVVTTVAGSINGYADGTGAAAQFNYPADVAVDAVGNAYVVDTNSHLVRKVSRDGVVTTLAGSYEAGTGPAASFHFPYGLTVDASGNLYVADHSSIRKVSPVGVVTLVTKSSAKFPFDVAVDASGNVFVSDHKDHRIRKINPDGVVTTLAGSTEGYADGTGAAAQFNLPTYLAVDTSGNVFVSDQKNHRIRKINPDGVVTTLAGSTKGYADGIGPVAQFSTPTGLDVDAAGNVYVADGDNNRIRKVSTTGVVTTLAGSTNGYADGIGAAAQFKFPGGVAVDAAGNVYVADRFNNRIRKIQQP